MRRWSLRTRARDAKTYKSAVDRIAAHDAKTTLTTTSRNLARAAARGTGDDDGGDGDEDDVDDDGGKVVQPLAEPSDVVQLEVGLASASPTPSALAE